MEVEVRESSASLENRKPDMMLNNTPAYPPDGEVAVVRIEEVLLVLLVLLIWVAAIALFINRWGKIRMLEPYQPKFHQQTHRPSCPLAPLSPPLPPTNTLTARQQKLNCSRMSFSKYNVNAATDPLSALPSPIVRKPRRGSAFVGGTNMTCHDAPPRRVKSAMDIHRIGQDFGALAPSLSLSGSVIPILNRERRASKNQLTEKSPFPNHHRASVSVERPLLSLQHYKSRRSSCFIERPVGMGSLMPASVGRSQRTLRTFENPHGYAKDRRKSMFPSMDRPTCSYHHQGPLVNFGEAAAAVFHARRESLSPQPLLMFDSPYLRETVPILKLPKLSRSFEQPSKQWPKPERMASSLEIKAISLENTSTIHEEERSSSPVSIYIEDTRITAPLIESLKSSDV